MRVRNVERIVLGVALGLVALGCGSSSSTGAPPDTAQQAVTDTNARLDGSWTLIEFQPAQPLEPMLTALLTAQMNQLTVTFHAGKMTVEGVGVNAERAWTVTHAAADGFDATLTDPTNVTYQVSGAFQGADVTFTSKSDPWRGQGRLRRAH